MDWEKLSSDNSAIWWCSAVIVNFDRCTASSRVYLTRNGRGEYGILTMSEIDELDRCRTAYTLFSKLKKAEERADEEGWISAEELEKELDKAIFMSERHV